MSINTMKLALEALERYEDEWLEDGRRIYVDAEISALRQAIEQAQKQEPVAYWIPKAEQFCIASPTGRPFAKAWEPLYTSPPQRQPLTDELVNDLYENLAADERTKQFTAQNWFQAGLSTGEAAHGIKGEA